MSHDEVPLYYTFRQVYDLHNREEVIRRIPHYTDKQRNIPSGFIDEYEKVYLDEVQLAWEEERPVKKPRLERTNAVGNLRPLLSQSSMDWS